MRLLSGAKFAAVVATAMILAGCGGDEGGSSSSTSGDKPVAPSPSPKNNPPVVSGAALTAATVGSSYVFQPTASDPDGDPIEYQVANKPAWATFDARSGRLSGTPADGDVGTYSNILISATDGKLSASLSAFSIAVSAAQSGAATLTWMTPTENTDGTALDDLAGFRIQGSVRGAWDGPIEAGSWTVRYRVPQMLFRKYYGEVLRPGLAGKANFYKCGDETAVPHYGAWSPPLAPTPDFHRPDSFGSIVFSGKFAGPAATP